MTQRRTFLRALAAGVAAGAATGCGYALVGRGTVVDPDIKKIGVPLFANSSSQPTLETRVTQSVIEELLKRGRFDVVPEAAGANAIVQGEIVAYRVVPVGFAGAEGSAAGAAAAATTQASRYEISLAAKVKYTKVGVDEPIWANDNFVHKEEYDLGADPAAFIDRESQALDRLTDAFARSLVASMLEAF